ncbi:TetR family transcriptional regulator [Leucobacter komagatae]|uniref:TetR family transcriptional regulator n=1 Tax=Leucobacter komagatae TaxID=55969 RepID=A0A542Y5W7_9MICO|nr:TetR family transcriptional regulator [Leucobacter komagatae]TQL43471.1 TetR family transcriptional regulator [Leucobacter komagatae]
MSSSPREVAKAQRRERYLEAAASLIAERGFSGVSIDLLGSAVGVSGPALYRHFSSKEDILTQLLVGASERLLAGYEAIIAEGLSDEETLRRLVRFHLDFATNERDVILAQERELVNLPEEPRRRVRSLQRRYVNGWVQITERLMPDASRADLTVRLHAVFGLLNSTPYSGSLASPSRVRDILADLALSALFTADSA